jgi:hypothetical protein
MTSLSAKLAEIRARLSGSVSLVDCDGETGEPHCQGAIPEGAAITIGRDVLCPPCAVQRAAATLVRWADPHFRPDVRDVREAQDARAALTVVLARIDDKLGSWAAEPATCPLCGGAQRIGDAACWRCSPAGGAR